MYRSFETFKEAVRVQLQVILLQAMRKLQQLRNGSKIIFWKIQVYLEKMDLPFQSEEDEKSLSSLQIEFENISEKNKKINNNNHLKSS